MSARRGPPRPRLPLRLLRRLLGPGPGTDSIVGDLHEERRAVAEASGRLRGELWLWWQALATGLGVARPGRATLDRIRHDLALSMRGMRREPGFALSVVVTLALGVGAGSAIFSVVDGVLLRPLPFPEADRIVRVWAANERTGDEHVDWMYDDLGEVRARVSSFASVAGLSVAPRTLMDERGEQRETIVVGRATPSLFGTLGVEPRVGRLFDEGDAAVGRRVLVISHGMWMRRFGGDPGAVGRFVHLDARGYEIIGVLPEGVDYPESASAWRPLGPEDTADDDRELQIVARLAPEAPRAIAGAEIAAVAAALAERTPESHAELTAWLQPLQSTVVRDVRTALLALLAAVGLVLAIACLNTANLFLARAARKREEAAVRTALGASRGRIVSTALVDSLLLSALGATAGVAVGRWALESMLSVSPRLPRMDQIVLDLRVMLVMGAVTTAAAVIFAVLPLVASPAPLERALRRGSVRATRSTGTRRLQSGLVSVEIALSTVLAVLALLLSTTFRTALTFDRGFEAAGLVTVTVDPVHPPDPGDAARAYFGAVEARIARAPGVEEVAFTSHGILEPRGFRVPVSVEGAGAITPTPLAWVNVVSHRYFDVAGIDATRGRGFSERGGVDGDVELVVNESFVREHIPDRDLTLAVPIDLDWIRGHVVGVVEDVSPTAGEPALPKVYVSFERQTVAGVSFAVRVGGDPTAAIAGVRAAIADVAPDVLIEDLTIVEQAIRGSVAPERFNMLLVLAFAALALTLAAIGVYGITAFTVTARRPELGVCRALGASDRRVVLDILRGVGVVTALGLTVGLVGAVASGGLLRGLLLDVAPTDPTVLVTVAGTVAGVALLGALVPIRKALGADPTVALRGE